MLPLSLDLSGDRDIQICANGSKINLRVKFLRESYPPLNHVSTMKFLVVEAEDEISIKPNLPLKGCCLQSSDSIDLSRNKLEQSGKLCASLKNFLSEHHKELRFTYDCPIRVEPQEDLSLLSHPETSPVSTPCRPDEAHQVAGPWTIIIKCSMCFQLYIFFGMAYSALWTSSSILTAYKISLDIVSKRLAVATSPPGCIQRSMCQLTF